MNFLNVFSYICACGHRAVDHKTNIWGLQNCNECDCKSYYNSGYKRHLEHVGITFDREYDPARTQKVKHDKYYN